MVCIKRYRFPRQFLFILVDMKIIYLSLKIYKNGKSNSLPGCRL